MFNISLPATPESVPQARRAVSDYARRSGLSESRLEDLRLVVSEAVTNVVLHAYRGSPGELHVAAVAADGRLWVVVGDDGDGIRPRRDSPGLGLGLGLIGRLSDGVEVDRRPDGGTELRISFRLREKGAVRPPAGSTGFSALGEERLYASSRG